MSTVAVQRSPLATEETSARLRSPLTLREVLTPAFYHWRPALLAALIPLVMLLGVTLHAKPVFVAQSRLLILLGGDYVFRDFHQPDNGSNVQSFDRAQIIHAETEILSASDLRGQTLQQVGLSRAYPTLSGLKNGLQLAEDQFGRDLSIDNVPQSNVIDLKLRNRDPRVAADLLNVLVKNYIVRRREVFDQADAGPFQTQRDALDRQLAQIEAQLAAFSSAHAFGDYNEALTSAQTQRSTLTSQLQGLDEQIATRGGRGASLLRLAQATPSIVELSQDQGRSQQLEALTQNLLALQTQRREAAGKFRDGYPLVTELDRQIAELQAKVRSAPAQQLAGTRRGVNPVRQQIDGQAADAQSDAVGLRQGRAQIQAAIHAADARLAELVQIGPHYRELVRRRTVVEAAYQDQAKNAEEAQFQTVLTRSHANVRVIEPAEPPLRGSSGRAAILGAGLVLAGVAALATILLLAAASQTMLTPRDLEQKMQTPTLLAVPRGRRAGTGRSVAGEGRVLRPAYLSVDEAKLLLRLLSSVAPGPSRVIQLIAAGDGAGVSSLAQDIAIIASAQYGRRVLLMDIEPQQDQSVSATLKHRGAMLSPLPGRSRILQVDRSSLYVTVPFGKQQLRGPAVDWAAVLATARRDFDLVIIDSPSLERSSSGVVISGLVDMTLAVVEAERTRAAAGRNLIDRIQAAGGHVLGAILNKRRFYIPHVLYSRL